VTAFEHEGNPQRRRINGKFESWVTGAVSSMAKQELQTRGFTVVEQAGRRFEIM
jgi:hypothetical protein